MQLDCEEDAEYIVAKAIRDGVIDATIDHESGSMKSNVTLNPKNRKLLIFTLLLNHKMHSIRESTFALIYTTSLFKQ